MPSQRPSRHSPTEAIFVGFAGHIGAGKTSAAQYLSEKYGFQYRRYSQVLGDLLESEPPGREDLQRFGWEVMAGGRQVELNARLIGGLDRSRSAVIDGLRHPIDFQCLLYAFGASFRLVFLDVAADIRFKRKPRFSTYEAFLAADSQPVEAHIDTFRPLAAATILNEGSLEGLYQRLDGLVAPYEKGEKT
jgi:dephospho-CoA kinase